MPRLRGGLSPKAETWRVKGPAADPWDPQGRSFRRHPMNNRVQIDQHRRRRSHARLFGNRSWAFLFLNDSYDL